jgi:hypothetical protein
MPQLKYRIWLLLGFAMAARLFQFAGKAKHALVQWLGRVNHLPIRKKFPILIH